MRNNVSFVVLCLGMAILGSCREKPFEPKSCDIGDVAAVPSVAIHKQPDDCKPGLFFTTNLEGSVNNINSGKVAVHLYSPGGCYAYKGILIECDGSFNYPLGCGTQFGAVLAEKSWARPDVIDWDTVHELQGVLAVAQPQ